MEVGLLEKTMLCPQCTSPCASPQKSATGAAVKISAMATGARAAQHLRELLILEDESHAFPSPTSDVCVVYASVIPQAAHMAEVSENTVSERYAAWQVLCSKELLNGDFKIGGEGNIAETNETSLKKKSTYGRGRHYKEFWLFGGVDRTTGQWLGRIVFHKRTKATLLSIIKHFIKPR
ncbi:hypothetical protein F444_10386 [Phytophthora nicotianae P1976]|uniref:ISXO2-like transposase domain-containing protein n=1 Tax=Phytophthora nicotianae P1976 TaxID=1317066 RepID=A0A081A468_PHYNI|nr:hypothetical protein F444_10386 [Phytophthora nicotianae P1976]